MPERFYFPDSLKQDLIELDGSEAHHLLNVLRMKKGEEVEIFNGKGDAACALIQSCTRKSVSLEVISLKKDADTNQKKIVVASAVPKGDRFRWMIEKMTELNVSEFIPLSTTRSVVDPGKGKMNKMEQAIISACKQSGRNRLMKINPGMAWSELCDNQTNYSSRLIAHPGGQPLRQVFAKLSKIETETSILLIIGPEGGLTADEIAQMHHGNSYIVSLGENILRIETAAIAGVAILQNQ
jgi:16S rRNA (uracil1498-N3)-methyltransferase